MPQATKECRVCGKTYTACNTNRHFDGSFHWREVACSPECGQKYLQKVIESRKAAAEPEEETIVSDSAAKEENVVEQSDSETLTEFTDTAEIAEDETE